MIITEKLCKLLYTQLKANVTGATDWYGFMGPDEAQYPFGVFIPINVDSSNRGFTIDMEKVLVQFNVFDDNAD